MDRKVDTVVGEDEGQDSYPLRGSHYQARVDLVGLENDSSPNGQVNGHLVVLVLNVNLEWHCEIEEREKMITMIRSPLGTLHLLFSFWTGWQVANMNCFG